jgi:polar amino acid transport system substrate-binding protein
LPSPRLPLGFPDIRRALRPLILLLAMATASLAQTAPQPAQTAGEPIRPGTEITVATRIIAPFVLKDGAELSGFSVDLWHAIGAELGIKSRFVTYDRLPGLLDAVRGGKNDAGIAAISITSERGETLDFSQPMFRSGLSIMVPADGQKLNVLGMVLSSGMLKAIGIFLLILIIPAHIIWFLARGRDDGLPISERYIPGIFDAIFWCAESMGGAAQAHPTQIFARVAAIIWIYAGIVLISYFTAFATTSLTLQTLRGEISGPGDLRGKRVAVVEGSTSAAYAGELGATLDGYKNFEAAAEAVLRGKAQAAVYDTPIILYFTKNEPRAQIAGAQFRPESYGIIFPLGSTLRRPVDLALLKLVENGTYASLQRKWFGQPEGGG